MHTIMVVVFEPACDQKFCYFEENKAITKKKKKIRMQIVQLTLCTRIYPVHRGLLLYQETVYQELYDIIMVCLYTSTKLLIQMLVESQFR